MIIADAWLKALEKEKELTKTSGDAFDITRLPYNRDTIFFSM